MSTRKHLLSKRGFEVSFKAGARKAGCNLVHSGEVGQGAMLRGFRVSRCQHVAVTVKDSNARVHVERLSGEQVSAPQKVKFSLRKEN